MQAGNLIKALLMIIITIGFYNNKLGKAPRSTKIMVKFSILITEKKKKKDETTTVKVTTKTIVMKKVAKTINSNQPN